MDCDRVYYLPDFKEGMCKRNQQVKLRFLDLTIHGGIGGEEALKKLYEIDAKVKAIASSGYSDDPVISGFIEYGFYGAIIKPYRIDEMSEVVSGVIGTPEHRQTLRY